jgi:Domain of unknown function (DUF4388)
MSLKGELTDLSLAELIEFFCNQRKTGRLTVSYPQAPAYFYLQSGSVVHASVGSLRGIEAVFYALTQSNASFNFSTAYEAPDQTINQPWTSVVLEGLRRMDEGIKPRNPFAEKIETDAQQVAAGTHETPIISKVVPQAPIIQTKLENIEQVEPPTVVESMPVAPLQVVEPSPANQVKAAESVVKTEVIVKPKEEVVVNKPKPSIQRPAVSETFLSSTHNASKFSSRPWKLAAVFAALVLIIAGISIPWGWRVRGKAVKAAEQPTQALNESAAQPQNSVATEQPVSASDVPPGETISAPANAEAAEAARREARAREEARLKARAAEANATAATTPNATVQNPSSTAPAQSTTTGPKKAVVQVTYDENGRVTQASGNDPTALRIARQRRFPPGKAGSATLTIPIN